MKKIMTAAAVAALVSGPAFAQSPAPAPGTGEIAANCPVTTKLKHRGPSRRGADATSAFGAVTPFGSPGVELDRSGRESAIRECNGAAAKTYPTRDSNWPIFS